MVRQYRIERFNGVEFLVCETYVKHTMTQTESEAFVRWREQSIAGEQGYATFSEFKLELDEWLRQEHDKSESFYGLTEPIPTMEPFPSIVARCAVVSNRPASLQVDFAQSVVVPEVIDEVQRLFDVFRSPYWRSMVSRQVETYGTLFGSEDDL